MNNIEKIKRVIRQLPVSKAKGIMAMYVFGSFREGMEKPRSDIDIAFLFDRKTYGKNPFHALQEAELLAAKISQKIQRPVDAVVLNGSSLVFAHSTIRNGICIYQSNNTDRILYEVTLENEYQDFIPFINELRHVKRKTLIGRNSV
jgi:predicted nucleotidyltransferase